MTINIQISDAVYAKLLNGTSRIQGSIGLVSPTEGKAGAPDHGHDLCREWHQMGEGGYKGHLERIRFGFSGCSKDKGPKYAFLEQATRHSSGSSSR